MALFLKMARIASGTDAKMAVPLRPYGKERGNAVNRGFGSLRPTPFVRDGDFSASKLSRRLWDRLKNSLSSRRIRRLGSAHLSCGHRVRQNPVGRLPTGGPHTMNAFVHVTVSTTVLLFAGCGTGEPKGQGLPAALQESSAEQDKPPAAKESGQYVVETFPGNKVEVAGVTVEILPFGKQPHLEPYEIVTAHSPGREDQVILEVLGVTLEIHGTTLSMYGIDYEIARGDNIFVNTGIVYFNGKRRTKAEFVDTHYIANARLRGILPDDEWPESFRGQHAMLLTGHTILEGDHTVLLWRWFYSAPHAMDSQYFRMLTIELDKPHAGKVYTFPSQKFRSFWSRGSSSWGGGTYCGSPVGTVRIDDWPDDGSAVVTVDFSMTMIDPTPDRRAGDQEQIKFNRTLHLSEITQDDFTPWLSGGSVIRPDSDPRAIVEADGDSQDIEPNRGSR